METFESKCKEIISLSSHKKQYLKANEEFAELQRAISRYLVCGEFDNLVEEIFDAHVMLTQVTLMLRDELGEDTMYELCAKWSDTKLKQLDEVIAKLKLAR